ncbi:MAG: ATP-binding protein [Bacteroidales bacterium]
MLFKDIPGHSNLKEQLIRNAREGRVSHTQLLLGPEGAGKLNLAIAFAQYLNCVNPSQTDSCGLCPSCRQFMKLAHPDLHFVFPVATTSKVKSKPLSRDFLEEWRTVVGDYKGFIGLDFWLDYIGVGSKQGVINAEECNEVIKAIGLKAYEGKFKIVIIYRIEQLFHAAAPKLLKVLEEPPKNTLFLLLAEDRNKILNTILSRSQIIQVPPFEGTVIESFLTNNMHVEKERASLASSISEGNMHRAISLSQRESLENVYFELFRDWMRLCYMGRFSTLFPFNNDIAKRGREQIKQFLSFGIRTARNCLLMNYAQGQLLHLSEEEMTFVKKFTPFFNPNNLIQIIEELEKSVYFIERNAHLNILLADLSVNFIKLLRVKG